MQSLRLWRARIDAEEMRVLASAAPSDEGEMAWFAESLVPEYRASREFVLGRVHTAVSLVSRMPRLLSLMDDGKVEYYAASRVVDVTGVLTDSQARLVDSLLADKLTSAAETMWLPHNLVRAARRLVDKVDPAGRVERARKADQGRKVTLEHGENCQSRLVTTMRSEVAAACYARVDSLARQRKRDGHKRTYDQLRADVVADLLLGNDPGTKTPEVAAVVYVHMPIDTALSISETGAELDGYGPIPGAIGREIATNPTSTWRKVLCDPATGDPVDLGRSRYRPSATLREAMRVRDRECVIPWCHRPARHCDTDHEQEWARDNGPTSLTNLTARCRRHHRMKNAPGWTTTHNPTRGTTTVTTPLGATHTGRREPVLPARAPHADDPPPF
ncbi:HNH endonuclease signature motif containing protein [Saccharomonospora sp. CUA-673]|uniref:HNH endonuclease signature motif containing protein n=1 Tax=Saccharomonospora sp. CUA-673 TaxID=1904969 RepID=UPI002100CE49|nr:HNH endonuclease signature motif containing protein [Saccharomonospora sp. CUA-673]